MKEAQRFPEDFDGIIAGAPALDWTGRAVRAVQVWKTLEKAEAAGEDEQSQDRPLAWAT